MKDLLLDENFDLVFENGDLVIGESSEQHQNLLLLTKKGDWKENPTIGVGINGVLKDDPESDITSIIRTEFQKDGMKVNGIFLTENEIRIDANY